MAFFGIELKPGKPYVHNYDEERGRLRLSQATLGSCKSDKRTIVQCVVGENKPINLCSLTPDKMENVALNHEFEEEDEVTFSTLGVNTVHLSGFFYGPEEEEGDACDIDHYGGEDVGSESESDEYGDDSEEDDDDDDFIDDDDIDMSPVPNSGVKIEEILDDEEEPTTDNTTSKKSKKKLNKDKAGKQLVVRETSAVHVLESEDEDGFPISSPGKVELSGEESGQKKEAAADKNLKRKMDVDQDDDTVRETADATPGNDSKKKKKNKKKKIDSKDDAVAEVNANDSTPAPSVSAPKEDKKNKKKNEKVVASNDTTPTKDISSSLESGEKPKSKVRTFPNGLVIEELAMGKPDGKKASNGKKVSVHYIGKLQKNGKIFDSNIGKAPFKFRLGIGQVIKGWDVGVNGMRVGDKRRLTIPPSMGYGAEGAKGAIPPNAVLQFDVELVNVN